MFDVQYSNAHFPVLLKGEIKTSFENKIPIPIHLSRKIIRVIELIRAYRK